MSAIASRWSLPTARIAAQEAPRRSPSTYEAQPAIVDSDRALDKGAPLVWPDFGTNIAYENAMGSAEAVAPLFDKAAHVVSLDVVNNRLVANFLEPRAAIGEYDAASGSYTLTIGEPGRARAARRAHRHHEDRGGQDPRPDAGRRRRLRHQSFHLPRISAAARSGEAPRPPGALGRRSQRAFPRRRAWPRQHHDAEMALDASGKFLALRVDIRANIGAYLSQFGPFIPWLGGRAWRPGLYDIPARCMRACAASTPTPCRSMPIAARAAGGGLSDGAARRSIARAARHAARRNPRAELHQARADAVQDAIPAASTTSASSTAT